MKLNTLMPTALLVDGNALMHRSFHAVKFNPLHQGKPVGMIYGMASALLQSLKAFDPDITIFGFDTKEKTFRHEADPDYKAQRSKAPDEFYAQIPLVDQLLEAFGIPFIKLPGFEADDIVGTLAHTHAQKGHQAIIMSNDMDYCQLLGPSIKLCRPQGAITQESIFTPEQAEAKMGVRIDQIIDFKAITGDSSDNYKGIDGIGPKGAATLLIKYKNLENIYQNLIHLPEKVRNKLEAQKDYVFHCQYLARIKTDVTLPEIKSLTDINFDEGAHFLEMIGFSALSKRALNMNTNNDQKETKEHKKDSKKQQEDSQMALF